METPAAISVLLVDDDPLVLAATARILRRHGMRAICASSPFGVSALVRKDSPDVVVLDYHMPGLDGGHLVRVLRSSPRTAQIPVVFYSGDCDDHLTDTAEALGAYVVRKGCNQREFVESIMGALGRQSAPIASAV
jgi:CheY-like chemotaxis protein